MSTLHVIYDDTAWADIIIRLIKANRQAMRIQRTGQTGTRGTAYAILHDQINNLLDELDALT